MVIVGYGSESIGMTAEGDFFVGIGTENLGDDFQLTASSGINLIFIKLEIKSEGIATLGIFDERRVINIARGDAIRVISKKFVEINFRNKPISRSGCLAKSKSELSNLLGIRGLNIH